MAPTESSFCNCIDKTSLSASDRSVSASMSRSGSENEFDPQDDQPLFPYERLYYSAKDKAELDAKPELERERVLADRSQQLEQAEMDNQLKRMIAARKKKEAREEASKKRKAGDADLEENQRKSSRQRTKVGGGKAGELSSAVANYKKHREEKAAREQQRRERLASGRAESPVNEYSDADAEAESDDGYDDYRDRDRRAARKRTSTPPRDDPAADLQDVQRVRIGRDNFAQVCATPGFAATVTGCYARVCLGPGRQPGQNEYRLCSIKGLEEGRPYAMLGTNGKPFLTNKYIVAAHGKATKPWTMLECSNSKFTDDEWRRYRLTMANDDSRMPSKRDIDSKLRQIDQLIKHKFTDAEITQKLKEQSALVDMVNKTSERKELNKKLQEAEDVGDEAAIQEIEDQLMNLVPMKLAMGTTMHGIAGSQKTQAQPRRSDPPAKHDQQLTQNSTTTTTTTAHPTASHTKKVYRKVIKSTPNSALDPTKLAVPTPHPAQTSTTDDELFGPSGSDISRAATPVNGHTHHLQSKPDVPLRNTLAAKTLTTPLLDAGSGNPISNSNGNSRSGTPVPASGVKSNVLPVIKKSRREDEVLREIDLGIDIEL